MRLGFRLRILLLLFVCDDIFLNVRFVEVQRKAAGLLLCRHSHLETRGIPIVIMACKFSLLVFVPRFPAGKDCLVYLADVSFEEVESLWWHCWKCSSWKALHPLL